MITINFSNTKPAEAGYYIQYGTGDGIPTGVYISWINNQGYTPDGKRADSLSLALWSPRLFIDLSSPKPWREGFYLNRPGDKEPIVLRYLVYKEVEFGKPEKKLMDLKDGTLIENLGGSWSDELEPKYHPLKQHRYSR